MTRFSSSTRSEQHNTDTLTPNHTAHKIYAWLLLPYRLGRMRIAELFTLKPRLLDVEYKRGEIHGISVLVQWHERALRQNVATHREVVLDNLAVDVSKCTLEARLVAWDEACVEEHQLLATICDWSAQGS